MDEKEIVFKVSGVPPPPEEYDLTITVSTGGTTSPAPGTHTYTEGEIIGVAAIPDSGYKFDQWELNGVSYPENPITVEITSDATLHAEFSLPPPPPPETYDVNLSAESGGTTDPTPGMYQVEAGATFDVLATSDEQHEFEYWTVDGAQYTENSLSLTITQDISITANFKEIKLICVEHPWLKKLHTRAVDKGRYNLADRIEKICNRLEE